MYIFKLAFIYNFGHWLKHQDKKVLYVDLDHQCNLTQTFDIFKNIGTVVDVFMPKNEVQIIKIDNSISIIPGYMRLDEIEKNISTQSNKDIFFICG